MKCRDSSVKRIDLFKKIESYISSNFREIEFILETEKKVYSNKESFNKLKIKKYLEDKNVIFLMLSDTEGMPNTVSEAISEDMLVISRDIGDILEILPNENIISKEFKFFINDIEKLIYLSEDEWNEFIRKQRVLLKKYILNSENDFSNLVNLFLKKMIKLRLDDYSPFINKRKWEEIFEIIEPIRKRCIIAAIPDHYESFEKIRTILNT